MTRNHIIVLHLARAQKDRFSRPVCLLSPGPKHTPALSAHRPFILLSCRCPVVYLFLTVQFRAQMCEGRPFCLVKCLEYSSTNHRNAKPWTNS